MKHAKLHSGLLQDLNKEPLIALGSEKRGPSFLCLQCSMDKTLRGDRDRERERERGGRNRDREREELGEGGGAGRDTQTDKQCWINWMSKSLDNAHCHRYFITDTSSQILHHRYFITDTSSAEDVQL